MAFPENTARQVEDMDHIGQSDFGVVVRMFANSPIQPAENRLVMIKTESPFTYDDGFASEVACSRSHIRETIVNRC